MKRPNLWWELEDKFVYLLSDVKIKKYVMKIPFIDSPKEAIKFCNDLIEHYNNGGIQFKTIYKETHLYMPKIDDYYKKFINQSTLLGCIPALNIDHPMSRSYYAVEVLDTELEAAAPVFYIPPGSYYGGQTSFIFDDEDQILSRTKTTDIERYNRILDNINKNPHVLFFHGCDDGHVGLRFKTFKLAMKYLNSLHYFEEVFKNPNLLYHN